MTIASITSRNTYTLNGSTLVYPYTFRILAGEDVQVRRRATVTGVETVLTYNVDYTVSGVGNTLGGSVTLTSAGTSGDTLVIRRNRALLQGTSLVNQGRYSLQATEAALDGLLTIDQQQQETIDRSLRLAPSVDPSLYDLTLPTPTAGYALVGTGAGFAMTALTTSTALASDRIPMVANAAARDAAYPAPSTNQRVFRLDTLTLERYTGTSWVGDVTGYPTLTGEVGVLARQYPVGDVRRYRAPDDVSTDWYTAIQNAITSCEAQTYLPEVRLQAFRYLVSKPLRITKAGLGFRGPGGRYNQAQISGSFVYGPLLVIAPSVASGYTALPTGTALLTGSGAAMTFDGTNTYTVSLRRELRTCELNGLTAFTAEATIKKASGTFSSDCVIAGSGGRRLRSETKTQAFEIGVLSGGQPYAIITVAGTSHQLLGTAGTVTVGVTHHLALSWTGAVARLYLDGAQVATTAAVGTLTQALAEDVTVGPSYTDWPEATGAGGVLSGVSVDGVRFSDTARYTSAFTAPTAHAASDSNTLALLNFDTQFDIFTTVHTKNGDGYVPLRRNNLVGITNCPYVQMSGVEFITGTVAGPYIWYCQGGVFENVRVSGTGPTGLFLGYNSYNCDLPALVIDLGGVGVNNLGMVMNVAGGVTRLGHAAFFGAAVQLVCCGGSILGEMPYFAQSTETIVNAILKGGGGRDGHVFTQPLIDSEVGGSFVAALMLSELVAFTSIGGEYEMFNTQAIWIDDNSKDGVYVFEGGSVLFSSATPASVFKIVTAPTRPIKVTMGQSGTGTPIPWADTNGAVAVTNLGYKVVPFSATPIFNAFHVGTFAITLTANVTASTIPNGTAGQVVTFLITQDATGGRTFVWPTNVKGAGTVLATASKVSSQTFVFDGTNWRARGLITDAT